MTKAYSIDDLVKRGGLYYEKSTDEPFTGRVDEGLARGAIKNGKQEVPWVQYHDDGQIYWKGAYKNGKREGPWVHYDVHGTKVRDRTGTYRNGVKVSD
jgi:hypothetical protein